MKKKQIENNDDNKKLMYYKPKVWIKQKQEDHVHMSHTKQF